MRATSSGRRTIRSPFSENITTMVKSSATRLSGLMRGRKRARYHSSPLTADEEGAGEESGDKRDSEVEADALGELPMLTCDDASLQGRTSAESR